MEYLKLISEYIKSFADSSRKLSPVVVFNLKKLVGENKLVGEQNKKHFIQVVVIKQYWSMLS